MLTVFCAMLWHASRRLPGAGTGLDLGGTAMLVLGPASWRDRMPGLSELHLERRQNMSFTANCTCRPGLDDVITPKVGPVLVLGAPRIGVFVRLMN